MDNRRRHPGIFLLIMCCIGIFISSCSPVATPSASIQSSIATPGGGTLYPYRGHHNGISAVAWSPDGKYIASAGFDKTVQVWEAFTGRHILTYYGHSAVVADVNWS